MPATVTLSTTTLTAPVDASSSQIKVASTAGLTAGTRLYLDQELMSVVSLDVSSLVNVRRGVDGTVSTHHDSGSVAFIGTADQFYSSDPQGPPLEAVLVSPWINVRNGTVWFAQGDALPTGQTRRWWQPQTTAYGFGALGVRLETKEPTSST